MARRSQKQIDESRQIGAPGKGASSTSAGKTMRARTLLARVVIFLGVVLALLVVGMSAYVGYRENLAR
jgi:hypothetical protein